MRGTLAAATLCAVAVASLAAIGWPASGYVDSDFAGFWLGSRAIVEGLDPYDPSTWRMLHERIGSRGIEIVPADSGYGYPLVTAVAFVPVALLPFWLAAPLWLVAQLAAACGALYALGRRLFARSLRRDLLVLLGLAAGSQPMWLLAEGGNVGGFLLSVTAGSGALLLAGRPRAAGVLAGLLALKPHPLIVGVPLLLVALPRRQAARMVAAAAAVATALVLASLLVRPGWIADWLAQAARIGGSPAARATLFGLLPPDRRPLGWIVVAVIVLGFALWSRGRSLPLAVGAAAALAIFCAPYGWSYDHTVLLVPAAVSLGLVADAGAPRRTAVLALLALAVVVLPWMMYVLAFRRGDEALTAFVPLAMLAVLWVSARLGNASIGEAVT